MELQEEFIVKSTLCGRNLSSNSNEIRGRLGGGGGIPPLTSSFTTKESWLILLGCNRDHQATEDRSPHLRHTQQRWRKEESGNLFYDSKSHGETDIY